MGKVKLSVSESPQLTILEAKKKFQREYGSSKCVVKNVKKGKRFTAPTGRPGQKFSFELHCK
jgi:hypothetical protein